MRSKFFLNKVNWSITFISVIITIIVAVNEDSFRKIFTQRNAFNSLTIILLLLVSTIVFLITQYIADKREGRLIGEIKSTRQELKTEKEEHRKTKLQLAISNRKIYDIDNERMTDVITGIPNHLMFEKDIAEIKKSMEYGDLYQVIFMDIDNFSLVNEKYGYFKGDDLIRSLAEELYFTMRRNEKIFKNEFIPFDQPLTENIYRKYNGGDEFIIIIKGNQSEAIGFLNRLHRQLKSFSDTSKILPEPFEITFHAGIAPLYAEDETAKITLSRVEQCFWIAKRKDSELRIKWFKDSKSQETDPLYTTAIKLFKKN